ERAWRRFSESSRATCVASAIKRADSRLVSAAIAHSKDLKSSAVRITRPSRRVVSICCWTSWISVRISARRSRGCCGVFSGCRRWLGLRLGMVVPLATGVSENDDYYRACGRRETPLQGTDSFGSLPRPLLAGSADARTQAGVHPARRRLHGPQRSPSGSETGRFVRPPELAQDPQPLGAAGQSLDEAAMVSQPQLLLGRRPSGILHRPDLHQP